MKKEINASATLDIKSDLKSGFKKLLAQAVFDLGMSIKEEEIELTHPGNPKYGDYSTNIAFRLAEEVARSPQVLAKELVKLLDPSGLVRLVQKVEAVGGFVNFYLSDEFFSKQVDEVLAKKEQYGKPVVDNKKKIVIEFGQPNTHKLPHVGHLRSYALGESLARLLEFAGHKVFRANYQGDVGLHVAKCLWAMNRSQRSEVRDRNGLGKKVELLQKAYVEGNEAYEQSPRAKKEIDELNIKIYQKDPQVYDLWQKTRQWSVDYYDKLNKRLRTKYHRLYFESEAAEAGKEIVLKNLGRVFKKSQGAVIFKGSKYGLHDRVFVTSAGNATYEAKDLALIFLKKKDFDYDLSLVATASEQSEYFKVVYQAVRLIDKGLAEKFVHIPFGLITLSGGKLSSRKGSIVSIDEVLTPVEGELRQIMEKKDYQRSTIEEVTDVLTVGAAKYALLKQAPIKGLVFDIKESVNLQGNSGPYLQYTFARAQSILRKAETTKTYKAYHSSLAGGVSPPSKQEKQVLKIVYQFPEVVVQATKEYAPNLVCNFLFDLAQEFNSFYEKERVIGHVREEFRLGMVATVAQVMENGLWLLGIEALSEM